MKPMGLRQRFFAAGALLVLTTIASGAWSAFAFARVARVVDLTLSASDQTAAATAALTNALEREDDALLLWLTGDSRADQTLARERSSVAETRAQLNLVLDTEKEHEIAVSLHEDIRSYEGAGDRLRDGARAEGLERYHREVNPLLRQAVAAAGKIRDEHFRSTQAAAAWARDEARRATFIVSAIALAAFALSIVVALRLARVVVWPLRELMRSVEAIREGDFDHRVRLTADDELGRLADGFNRMAEDVAEFRRSNLGEVLRAKETLEAVLAALPDAVLVIDAEGCVSSANAAASGVLGSLGASASDRVADIALPEAAREAVDAALRGDATSGGIELGHAFSIQLGDRARRLLPRATPVADAKGERGAVLALYDVTELARLDELRVELVAVASHELRTPLTTLRMTLLMLQEGARELGARPQALVETALLGVEQLAATIDEFLDLTRIEAGQLRLTLDHVDVGTSVRRAVASVALRSKEAGVAIETTIAEVPAPIRADAARIGVVLLNLLDNALKYAPPGGQIAIAVSSLQNAGSGGPRGVQIAVTDDGPGVPAALREKIFENLSVSNTSERAPVAAPGAPGSGSTSRGRSSRRTAARSGARPRRAAKARRSCWSCRSGTPRSNRSAASTTRRGRRLRPRTAR